MSKGIRTILAILLLIPTFYCWDFLLTVQDGVTFTNSILTIPLAVVLFRMIVQSLEKDTRYYKYAFPLGLFFSCALVWGIQLSRTRSMDFHSKRMWLACIIYAVVFAMMLGRLFHWLDACRETPLKVPAKLERLIQWKHFGIFCVVFMLVSWIPVWLASYPGFFCYDVGIQYDMFVSGTITKHHPVIHTWLIGIFLSMAEKWTGSVNPGIVALTWTQMIFLACVFSYVLQYIKKAKSNGWLALIGLGVYSLHPTIQMYIGCTTKDLIYTGFFTLMVVKVIQVFREPKEYWDTWGKKIQFVLILFMTMAFRNNALYIIAVFAILCIFLMKEKRRIFLPIAGIAMGLYILYNGWFLGMVGIADGSAKEMLSVPINQLGRVYIYNSQSYSEEEKELLFEIIPKTWWDCYQPKTADAIKGATVTGFDEEFYETNKGSLFKVWFETGLENPGLYLEAFLLLTVDSWCPDSILDGHVGYFYSRDWIQSCYFTPQVDQPGVLESKWPSLYDKIVDMGYHISFQKIPVLSMLFSVGAMLWFYLTAFAYAIYKKQRYFWIPLLLIGLSYGTHLLGPMVLVRYHLILFFMIPIYLWILFDRKQEDIIIKAS